MNRTMDFIKGCGQMSSNDILFDDRWFNGLKTTEEANVEVVDYCGAVKSSHKGFFLSTLKNY